jgi:serine/threonine-protein phosphatase 2A regulatory subunit B'
METKELKRLILLELVDLISTTKTWFTLNVLKGIIRMVSANLFRTLPQSPLVDFDPEEDEPSLDPSWPHIQIVYEFLLRFIVSSDSDGKLMKEHVTQDFVLRILDLFNSEDPRERDYLKTILHRIYGKFMGLRPFIRKAISNLFYEFIYESNRHNGAGELLEILGLCCAVIVNSIRGKVL